MSYKKAKIVAAVIGALFLLTFVAGWIAAGLTQPAEPTEPAPAPTTTTQAPTVTTRKPEPTEPARGPYYPLTARERDLVERVVMAEAGGEPYQGQMAVAQCILNASALRHLAPAQVVEVLKYTKARPEPTESVKRAVSAVFDDGATVFDREVIYFYAPALTRSTWHEAQIHVATIGCHKFFKEAR